MSFSVLAKRNGAEPNVLNGACANVACPNVFARMDFVEMGSALRMPYAQLTLRAIPRILFVTFPRWIPTLIHAIR